MFNQLSIVAKSIQKMGVFYGLVNTIKLFTNHTNALYIPLSKSHIKLRPKTSDVEVYKQILLWEEYKIPIQFEPKVIIDAGGNIGLSALYFSSRFPMAKIYVLEPDKNNFAVLEENTTAFPNIFPIENALWGSNMSFKVDNSESFWEKQIVQNLDAGSNTALTVGDMMKNYNLDTIDILKLDIEGAEKNLFQGDVSWLANVKMIIIELHDFMIPECSKTFFTAIEKMNYSMGVSGENIIINNLDLV